MKDDENPNLLDSVRHMASQAFSKTSRLSVPAADSPTNMKNWKRSDPNAQDLARTDGSSVINSNNDFTMFIKTKDTPVGWAEKSRSYHNRRSGTQSCSRAQLDGMSRNMNGTGISFNPPKNSRRPSGDGFEIENVNKIRLEHFQNYKKLRREMDRAYLKVRHLQATGHGGSVGGQSDMASDYTSDNNNNLHSPMYAENLRTYSQISSTLNTLHAQQVYFGGFYGHNDPITPSVANPLGTQLTSIIGEKQNDSQSLVGQLGVVAGNDPGTFEIRNPKRS